MVVKRRPDKEQTHKRVNCSVLVTNALLKQLSLSGSELLWPKCFQYPGVWEGATRGPCWDKASEERRSASLARCLGFTLPAAFGLPPLLKQVKPKSVCRSSVRNVALTTPQIPRCVLSVLYRPSGRGCHHIRVWGCDTSHLLFVQLGSQVMQ